MLNWIITIMINLWASVVDLTNSIYHVISALGATYPTAAVTLGGAMIISVIVDIRRNGF